MLKARFTAFQRGNVVCLEDQSEEYGTTTITNDAEAVVQHVLNNFFGAQHIVYRDSEGMWDELLFSDGKFVGFKALRATDFREAVEKANAFQKEAAND